MPKESSTNHLYLTAGNIIGREQSASARVGHLEIVDAVREAIGTSVLWTAVEKDCFLRGEFVGIDGSASVEGRLNAALIISAGARYANDCYEGQQHKNKQPCTESGCETKWGFHTLSFSPKFEWDTLRWLGFANPTSAGEPWAAGVVG